MHHEIYFLNTNNEIIINFRENGQTKIQILAADKVDELIKKYEKTEAEAEAAKKEKEKQKP